MKAVKTLPRFKCDFCKKRSTKQAMIGHEKICFRNPNRFCDLCKNTGKVDEGVEDCPNYVPCIYCSKFDPKQLKEIEAREKGLIRTEKEIEEIINLPF